MLREIIEAQTKMKTAGGDDTVVMYSDKQFWFNGESLGKDLKTARAKLLKITNNSNFIRKYLNPKEMKDKATIDKSIERHLKKIMKKDKSEFDFLSLLKEDV